MQKSCQAKRLKKRKKEKAIDDIYQHQEKAPSGH